MIPFEVYSRQPITLVKAKGCYVWDDQGNRYLDMYGGHAVISIGHTHPEYCQAITRQVTTLGFYSNSVQNPLQEAMAKKLGELSGYEDYRLFMVNSGAEAIENALKIASFTTGKKQFVALASGFHGRTSLALGVTDNPKLKAAANRVHECTFVEIEDVAALEKALSTRAIAAVVVEGIQGIAGIYVPSKQYLQAVQDLCKTYGALLIIDEIQSGYGRTGKFFAHQFAGIRPDLITIAKGMGNGLPMGGVLINPAIKPGAGMLGTTFGGNHLACAAGLTVLKVIEAENLMENATKTGNYLIAAINKLPAVEVRGRGLMLGLEFNFPIKDLRQRLLNECQIFTGVAANPQVLRVLPPLSLTMAQARYFIEALQSSLAKTN